MHRGTDGDGLVHGHPYVNRLRNRGFQLRQESTNAIHCVDDVGAWLAKDDYQNGRLSVGITRIPNVFGRINGAADVRYANGRSVVIGDEQRFVVYGLEKL